jgi:restriction system protein
VDNGQLITALVLGLAGALAALWVGRVLWWRLCVASFVRRYGHRDLVGLPDYRTRMQLRPWPEPSFDLGFPRYTYATHDGSPDRRHAENPIIWPGCALRLGRYTVTHPDPCALMTLVDVLRLDGVDVGSCAEERERLARERARAERERGARSTQELVERFQDRPTDFERYCAALFCKMGYSARVTPPTNDGGYDIRLDAGGETWLVECKCYGSGHPVSRPAIQKLVGANSVQQADHLLFVTTSTYAQPALAYARQAGVQLIDGERLVELGQQVGGRGLEAPELPKARWQLNQLSVRRYYPPGFYA